MGAKATQNETESVVQPKNAFVKDSTSIAAIFERIEDGKRKKEAYEAFNARLNKVKDFVENLDGSGLLMTVENQNGESITFSNLQMIEQFLSQAVRLGNEYLFGMETDLILEHS